MGSASCDLKIDEKGGERHLLFTGDVGRTGRPILRDPVRPTKADILISESTYGDRLRPTRTDVAAELGKVVQETFDRGGRLLIPAFAVGRMAPSRS